MYFYIFFYIFLYIFTYFYTFLRIFIHFYTYSYTWPCNRPGQSFRKDSPRKLEGKSFRKEWLGRLEGSRHCSLEQSNVMCYIITISSSLGGGRWAGRGRIKGTKYLQHLTIGIVGYRSHQYKPYTIQNNCSRNQCCQCCLELHRQYWCHSGHYH